MHEKFKIRRMRNLFRNVAVATVVFLSAQYANAQQKIGHVNADDVFQLTAEFKAANEQLKTLNDTKTKELQDMFQMFQQKQNEANEKLRNRSEANREAVDAELQTLGQELQDMEQRMQENQRIAQEEVGKKQQELLAPIQTKVMTAINAVAKEKGFAYILDTSNGNVLYFDGGEDITADVKTKLNIKE